MKIQKIIGIDTDDKLPNDIILKQVVITLTCLLKDDDNYYPQMFLDETLHDK